MKKIYMVTGNTRKVEIAKASMAGYGFEVEQIDIETPEIQSDSAEEVVKYSVKYAAEKTGKPVFKADVGLHINALNGFPGPFIKYINKWFKLIDIIALMKNYEDKSAYFTDALGYCEPGKDPVVFIAKTFGKFIEKPSGDNGILVDSIFIPEGYNKTIASMNMEESIRLWNNKRYQELAEYLNK